MTRRWLVVIGGLLLGTSFATLASGAEPTRPPSLAERVAAMSRGWKKNPPAANPSGVVQASHTEAAGAPQEPARFPQVDARSLIPTNLFGRGGNKPIAGTAERMAEEESRQSTGSTARTPIPPQPIGASSRRTGTAQPSASDRRSFSQSMQTHSGSATGGPGISSTGAPSDAAISGRNFRSPPNQQAMPSSRRPQPGIAAQPPQMPSVARQPSPRRSPTGFSAEEIQRELSGSTPIGPIGTEQPEPIISSTEISDQPSDETEAPAPASPSYAQAPAEDSFEPTPMPAAEQPLPTTIGSTSRQAEQSWEDEPSSQSRPNSYESREEFAPTIRSTASRPARRPQPEIQAFDEVPSSTRGGRELLVENQTPVITSDIHGPKQILVGREAIYQLRLQNQGDFVADDVVASVRVPAWAEVINTSASRGVIREAGDGDQAGTLEWHLQQLDAGANETLELKLIPRSSRPLELGITWTSAPVGSRAVVEVQEPKLKMSVSGPEEVLYGKPQLYRLTLSNPGTGEAENVRLELMPPGGGEGAVTSHRIGSLPAGASKTLEVELTAREAGQLKVKASATAEGGLTTAVAKDIFCRKAELEVDWRGPEMTYAGTEATYFFRVRNPGTATANEVAMTISLPEGVELVSASEGQSFQRDRGEVSWQVGSLNPGDDFYTEIKCLVNTPGDNQLHVQAATATGELSDSKRAHTEVVAVADLKLDVTDPTGPVPVGEEAVYEILVQNRGANTAHDVNIVALFSEGIEPISAEGAQSSIADGRVAFHTIDSLPAGRQISLRIRGRAVSAGNHVFRTEVLCRDLEIKLAAEETTRFFDGTSLAERGTPSKSGTLR